MAALAISACLCAPTAWADAGNANPAAAAPAPAKALEARLQTTQPWHPKTGPAAGGAGETPAAATETLVLPPPKPVRLSVWSLPRPEDTSIGAKCGREILAAFHRKYPHITLYSVTGITIPEMYAGDTRALMAIAGGVAPDVIYVNFRQSDTYIQEGFLYPLDQWFEKLSPEERAERVLPQVRPVIYRYGPGFKTGRDTKKHYWALPFSNLVMGLCWRKDIFQQAGLDPERPPDTWEEYYEFARRCTNPEKGMYGVQMYDGPHWSWGFYWMLVSAGGSVMTEVGPDRWAACFNTEQAVNAYDFLLRLVQAPCMTPSGKMSDGVAYRDDKFTAWAQGRAAMRENYFTDEMLMDINPQLVGIAPMPKGPDGRRASELNCPMCGIFATTADKGPEVLDAAWKFVYFMGSPEAKALRTKVYVENGYGLFANPQYLEKLGYHDYVRRIPKGWRDAYDEALRSGEPEPYGRNCQNVYKYMTWPADRMLDANFGRKRYDAVQAARQRLAKDRPDISEAELAAELAKAEDAAGVEVRRQIKKLLDQYVELANEKMIGQIPPAEMAKRRWVAFFVAVGIAGAFAALMAYIIKVFTPPGVKARWNFRRHWLAYLLLVPSLGAITLWQYLPMVRGGVMAFQDYHIVLPSTWAGLDNFANVLWDPEFWRSLKVSLWYAFLSIVMGFVAPIALAILLQEVPRGKVIFRTLYYLPAVVSGLVVMLMWKSFFEPTSRGLLNQVLHAVPPWGWWAGAAVVTASLAAGSYFNFRNGRRVAGPVLAALAVVGAAATGWLVLHVRAPLQPQRWLADPNWAMFCIILPTIWAGVGPGCLIYLAALKTIPDDLYEAADLDGAGFFGKAWHVAIPTIKVLIVINFIGAVVNAFRVAAYILAMTGGGPAGATEVLALKVFYDAFVYLRFGIATATAWILGAMLIGFTVFQLRRLSRVEFRTAG